MRRFSVLLLAGCGGGQVCDDAACATTCEDHEATLQASVEEGGTVLSAYEMGVLGEQLLAIRTGVRVRADDGFAVCEGTARCDRVIGSHPPEELPVGSYVIVANLEVPAVGAWSMTFRSACTPEGGETEVAERVVPLGGRSGAVRLDPLHVFPPRPGVRVQCKVELWPADGAPGAKARVSFTSGP